MAAVSKGYGVGDTVYVWYNGSITDYFLPQSRVVKAVDVNTSTNSALVSFTNGVSITDGTVQTVYTTQVLCANAIVSAVVAASAPVCVISDTLSEVSTAGQVSVTLGLIG